MPRNGCWAHPGHRGHQNAGSPRRLIDLVTKFANGIFYPEEVDILTAAFDDACERLQGSGATASAAREILARQIIMAAKRGERNARHLSRDALLTFDSKIRRPAVFAQRSDGQGVPLRCLIGTAPRQRFQQYAGHVHAFGTFVSDKSHFAHGRLNAHHLVHLGGFTPWA